MIFFKEIFIIFLHPSLAYEKIEIFKAIQGTFSVVSGFPRVLHGLKTYQKRAKCLYYNDAVDPIARNLMAIQRLSEGECKHSVGVSALVSYRSRHTQVMR